MLGALRQIPYAALSASTIFSRAARTAGRKPPITPKIRLKKIDGVLDQLEAESKALKGKPTIGTISIGCALGYLDFRFGHHDWRAKRPKLAKWFAAFAKTPAMKATVPPPA